MLFKLYILTEPQEQIRLKKSSCMSDILHDDQYVMIHKWHMNHCFFIQSSAIQSIIHQRKEFDGIPKCSIFRYRVYITTEDRNP
jgi:hypothetical protein